MVEVRDRIHKTLRTAFWLGFGVASAVYLGGICILLIYIFRHRP